MPKRRSGGRDCGGRTAKGRRRHLYLAFDDSLRGYSIRKVDLSSDSDSDDGEEPRHQHGSGDELRLPLPPAVFRLEAPRGSPHYFTAAFGTRIMAMHPKKPGTDGKLCLMSKLLVPVFDVRSGGVIFAPRHKADLADPIYIPVGDRLFALASGSFELLWPPPLEHPGDEHLEWT
ncbi:hypothetical protein C2845_PM02G05000 [Panicum miliaceum]|uniref:Uncharacterized protein n=1 Tax=Panicum miliaceum TaxID=4540 RepID=A0A3L6S3P1_PANMI|nr:hypothetical protein C2845_PM02G05000 [Panicum miliaceum]